MTTPQPAATYRVILDAIDRGEHVIVTDVFMDWLDTERPGHSIRTVLNRNPLGKLDRYVAFVGEPPADAGFDQDGMMLANGRYVTCIVPDPTRQPRGGGNGKFKVNGDGSA